VRTMNPYTAVQVAEQYQREVLAEAARQRLGASALTRGGVSISRWTRIAGYHCVELARRHLSALGGARVTSSAMVGEKVSAARPF
jgi:hypothetical protein